MTLSVVMKLQSYSRGIIILYDEISPRPWIPIFSSSTLASSCPSPHLLQWRMAWAGWFFFFQFFYSCKCSFHIEIIMECILYLYNYLGVFKQNNLLLVTLSSWHSLIINCYNTVIQKKKLSIKCLFFRLTTDYWLIVKKNKRLKLYLKKKKARQELIKLQKCPFPHNHLRLFLLLLCLLNVQTLQSDGPT